MASSPFLQLSAPEGDSPVRTPTPTTYTTPVTEKCINLIAEKKKVFECLDSGTPKPSSSSGSRKKSAGISTDRCQEATTPLYKTASSKSRSKRSSPDFDLLDEVRTLRADLKRKEDEIASQKKRINEDYHELVRRARIINEQRVRNEQCAEKRRTSSITRTNHAVLGQDALRRDLQEDVREKEKELQGLQSIVDARQLDAERLATHIEDLSAVTTDKERQKSLALQALEKVESDIKQRETALSKLVKQIDEETSHEQTLTASVKSLDLRQETAEKELERLAECAKELRSQIDRLRNEEKAATTLLTARQTELKEIETKMASEKKQLDQVKTQLKEQQDLLKEVRTALKATQQEVADAKEALKTSQTEQEGLTESLKTLEKDLASKTSELTSVTTKIAESQTKQAELTQATRAAEEAVSTLNNRKELLGNCIKEMESQKTATTTEVTRLRNELTRLEKEKTESEKIVTSRTAELKELDINIRDHQNTLNEFIRRLNELDERMEEFKSEGRVTFEMRKMSVDECLSLRRCISVPFHDRSIEPLGDEAADAVGARLKLENELDDLTRERDAWLSQRAEVQKEVAELLERSEKLRIEAADAEASAASCWERLTELRSNCAKATADLSNLTASVKAAREEKRNLEVSEADMKKRLAQIESSIARQTEQLREAEKQSLTAALAHQQKLEEMQAERDDIIAERDMLERDLKDLRAKCQNENNRQERLATTNAQLERIQQELESEIASSRQSLTKARDRYYALRSETRVRLRQLEIMEHPGKAENIEPSPPQIFRSGTLKEPLIEDEEDDVRGDEEEEDSIITDAARDRSWQKATFCRVEKTLDVEFQPTKSTSSTEGGSVEAARRF